MTPRRATVVVAGFSARALARSALAAGFAVRSVDGFGDRDLLEPAPAPLQHHTVQPFHPHRAALVAAAFTADAAAYTSSFENHPRAVERLARQRTLWGNPASVLLEIRRPERVAGWLARRGLATPRVAAVGGSAGEGWLAKPYRSGGGHGIHPWHAGTRLRRNEYLQEFVPGVPGSLVFLADGRRLEPVALTRQLVGDPRFGASGMQYAGSLLASRRHALFAAQDDVFASAVDAAAALVAAAGLVGLNTLDFVARDGVAWPVEVNPRYSASVELVERELGRSLFGAHVDAVHGTLPRQPHDALGWRRVPGKAIVFARGDGVMQGSDALLAAGDAADVPADGTPLPRGGPVCTLFAAADGGEACLAALAARALAVHP